MLACACVCIYMYTNSALWICNIVLSENVTTLRLSLYRDMSASFLLYILARSALMLCWRIVLSYELCIHQSIMKALPK